MHDLPAVLSPIGKSGSLHWESCERSWGWPEFVFHSSGFLLKEGVTELSSTVLSISSCFTFILCFISSFF